MKAVGRASARQQRAAQHAMVARRLRQLEAYRHLADALDGPGRFSPLPGRPGHFRLSLLDGRVLVLASQRQSDGLEEITEIVIVGIER